MFVVVLLALAASSVAFLTVFGKSLFADRTLRSARLAALAACLLVVSVGGTSAQAADSGWCRYCSTRCILEHEQLCQNNGCGAFVGCEPVECTGVSGKKYAWRVWCAGAF